MRNNVDSVPNHSQSTVVSVPVYEAVRDRSGGHCEALVSVLAGKPPVVRYTRCGRRPIEIHHRITRARGGTLLDDVGETYHLMALCREHHNIAHDQDKAFESGLLLEGSVVNYIDGPAYTGPDEYLKKEYA